MSRHSYLSVRVTLGVLTGLLLSIAARAQPTTPIAAARAMATGTEVTVEGRVSVPSGAFMSATFDKGFGLRDASGGIWVSIPDTDLGLEIGDQVRVTGTRGDLAKLLTIMAMPDQVEVVERRGIVFRTGSIGPDTEGALVNVVGDITKPLEDDLPFGFKLYIDDGSGEVQIFIHDMLGFDPRELALLSEPGTTIFARGFSGRFDDTQEIQPRRRRDIRRVDGGLDGLEALLLDPSLFDLGFGEPESGSQPSPADR